MKKYIINKIKMYPRLDDVLWRIKHPFRGDEIDLLKRERAQLFWDIRNLNDRLSRSNEAIRVLRDSLLSLRTRASLKRTPSIRVAFVCMDPALWAMYETLYESMTNDELFDPLVVAMPDMQYSEPFDRKMYEYCVDHSIRVVNGYDYNIGTWLDPLSLRADYMFFMKPYNHLPGRWKSDVVSGYTRLCYSAYAIWLQEGHLTHPEQYLSCCDLIFEGTKYNYNATIERFASSSWFDSSRVILAGLPKLDKCREYFKNDNSAGDRVTILWNPRWRTSEGTCHFFKYRVWFEKFASITPQINFILRPHPLLLRNFVHSGEMSQAQVDQMFAFYDKHPNMQIDTSGDYRPALKKTDILVSDTSSLIVEFILSGRPVVYTDSGSSLNSFGHDILNACYAVRSACDLEATITKLIAGFDDMKDSRRATAENLLFFPPHGSGALIKDGIRSHYQLNHPSN